MQKLIRQLQRDRAELVRAERVARAEVAHFHQAIQRIDRCLAEAAQ